MQRLSLSTFIFTSTHTPVLKYKVDLMGKFHTCTILFVCFIIQVLFFFISSSARGISGKKVPAIIVFGDSSVDSGNNNFIPTIARSNFEPYGRDFFGGNPTGRFSNGRIPPDFISEAFGLKPFVPAYLDPSYNISDFAVGVCFASAGTGYDNATSNVAVCNIYPSSFSHFS